MIDFRPVGYVIGLLVTGLGIAMLVPMALDLAMDDGNGHAFLEAALFSTLIGGLTALACRNAGVGTMTMRQAFLLTFFVWVVLPLFGALPFLIGAPDVGFTDAYFEAVSGITTTGS